MMSVAQKLGVSPITPRIIEWQVNQSGKPFSMITSWFKTYCTRSYLHIYVVVKKESNKMIIAYFNIVHCFIFFNKLM